MLEIMFYLLLIVAIILIILAIEYRHNDFWELIFICLDIPLWFIIAVSNMELERPWTMYNSTSGNVETGIYTITSPISPYLTYFFMGIGVVVIIYLISVIFGEKGLYRKFRGY